MAVGAKSRALARARERTLKRRQRRESQLLEWQAKRLPGGKLGLECPRPNCRGKVVVNGSKWLNSKPDFETRSCTYCYVPSWIPEGFKL